MDSKTVFDLRLVQSVEAKGWLSFGGLKSYTQIFDFMVGVVQGPTVPNKQELLIPLSYAEQKLIAINKITVISGGKEEK